MLDFILRTHTNGKGGGCVEKMATEFSCVLIIHRTNIYRDPSRSGSTRKQDGNTPLIWAAQYNSNPEVIKILLELEASPKVKNKFGKIAPDYEKENENLKNTGAFLKLNDDSY